METITSIAIVSGSWWLKLSLSMSSRGNKQSMKYITGLLRTYIRVIVGSYSQWEIVRYSVPTPPSGETHPIKLNPIPLISPQCDIHPSEMAFIRSYKYLQLQSLTVFPSTCTPLTPASISGALEIGVKAKKEKSPICIFNMLGSFSNSPLLILCHKITITV